MISRRPLRTSGGLRARWRKGGGPDDVEVSVTISTPLRASAISARSAKKLAVSALDERCAVSSEADSRLSNCASYPRCSIVVVLGKDSSGDGPVGGSRSTAIYDAKHLFRAFLARPRYPWIRGKALASESRPEASKCVQAIRCELVEQDNGREHSAIIIKRCVEPLAADLQAQHLRLRDDSGMCSDDVVSESRSVANGILSQNHNRRIEAHVPKDGQYCCRKRRICCEIATPSER